MIIVKGRKVYFRGKDAMQMKLIAEDLGLSEQAAFTGMLWEHIMRLARQGMFKKGDKNASRT